MDLVIAVGSVFAAIVIGAVIVAAALRSMRPKAPEPQVYTPSPTMARSVASTSTSTAATSQLTPAAIAEVDRLVAAGQKIQAIKLYRQHTGVRLQEAKDRIDHWSVSTTAPHLAAVSNAAAASSSITATPSSVRGALPASVVSEVDRLIAGDQKIQAIKLVREHTDFGLKQAKDIVEAWPRPHRL
ncbi:ribosomal protein L7/L12 [Microbacterium hydrocarbonoxydans]|uniref:Ribosomal protein L7/L12 C-terminal domain-containing protein n=1 Tax=Microbacterium hydrocarbonoxydans TaxID=273678 RepID=A0A1H4JC40_9MICO|nr:ribosomal protein L7/L12 [Microbacterium hydrocarbonoxydans]SEB43168.1 Ribosomal protein L7/L12 C-terminal domain-containing protein [Microbacterium hydrocarbonoxydans]